MLIQPLGQDAENREETVGQIQGTRFPNLNGTTNVNGAAFVDSKPKLPILADNQQDRQHRILGGESGNAVYPRGNLDADLRLAFGVPIAVNLGRYKNTRRSIAERRISGLVEGADIVPACHKIQELG